MPETKEELEQKPEVRKELARAVGEKKADGKVKARGTDKFWFVTHGLLLIGCAVFYYLIGRVKTRLIKKLLAALNAAPEKVMFPAGANR